MANVISIVKQKEFKKPRLSIITVVKNDDFGLLQTCESLELLPERQYIQSIVWINHSGGVGSECLERLLGMADTVVLGIDDGIFDAMNGALQLSEADFCLFLNARDIIEEPFFLSDLKGPALIKITYLDYFDVDRFVKVSKTLKLGIPYCHQGIVLPRIGYAYDANYKYGADYLALLDCKVTWPLPVLPSGLIRYDTTGTSSVNRWESDKWTFRIIKKRFGCFWAGIYITRCLLKLSIKRIYDVKRIFSDR